MRLTGDLAGPGVLTLIGAGTLSIQATWRVRVSKDLANSIVARDGTVDLSGATFELVEDRQWWPREYVIVDWTAFSGSCSGRFAATNGLPASWAIDYDGTPANPECTVLVPAPKGTVLFAY
jgi:hypothetical protein